MARPDYKRRPNVHAEDATQIVGDALDQIWEQVQPLIGSVTLSALFASAVRRTAAAHPELAGLHVGLHGVDRASLQSAVEGLDAKSTGPALKELLQALL